MAENVPRVWFPALYSVLILRNSCRQQLAHLEGHLLNLEDGQAEAGEKQNSFRIPCSKEAANWREKNYDPLSIFPVIQNEQVRT